MLLLPLLMKIAPRHLIWVGIIGAFLTLHVLNVKHAVRTARSGYVAEAELTAAEAARTELQRRLDLETIAKMNLTNARALADTRSAEYRQEVQNYVQTAPEADRCTVSGDLFNLLQR